MGINTEQILKNQITAAVSGVPTRKSRIDSVMPEAPRRKGGRIMLDAYDRVRVDEAPILAATVATDLRQLRPVSMMWPSPTSPTLDSVLQTLSDEGISCVQKWKSKNGAYKGAIVNAVLESEKVGWNDRVRLDSVVGAVTEIRRPDWNLSEVDMSGNGFTSYVPCMGVYRHIKRFGRLKRIKHQEIQYPGEQETEREDDQNLVPGQVDFNEEEEY